MSNNNFDTNEELLEEAIKRVRKGETNGDVQETNLLVTIAIYEMVKKLDVNPLVRLGKVISYYPAITIPMVVVGWVLAGASAILAIMSFFNSLGIVVSIP